MQNLNSDLSQAGGGAGWAWCSKKNSTLGINIWDFSAGGWSFRATDLDEVV